MKAKSQRPGLIDSHIHAGGSTLALEQALRFGVTSVLDMHNEPHHVANLKEIAKKRHDVADFKSACHAATIENGHPAYIVTLFDKSEQVCQSELVMQRSLLTTTPRHGPK